MFSTKFVDYSIKEDGRINSGLTVNFQRRRLQKDNSIFIAVKNKESDKDLID